MSEQVEEGQDRLEVRLRKNIANAADANFEEVERFLMRVVRGLENDIIVDAKTGSVTTARPCVKDRLTAAKGWKELVIDKRAADKREKIEPPKEQVDHRKIIEELSKKREEVKKRLSLVSGGQSQQVGGG